MLSSGIFQTRLKFSEVKPIFKRGDQNDTPNYRPVSLLTSFSKIFEQVIYNRLYHHINNIHILINEQFGFRHASSRDIVSYKLTKNILTELNNKLLVGGNLLATFIRHLTVSTMTSCCLKWNFMVVLQKLIT
jgi:hypothetical protein